MLRLAEPLLSNRLGGWATVESPPQRTAVSGRQWSLLILTTAALVAMLAVVFDIRLSSEGALLAGLPATTAVESTERTALVATPTTVPVPTAAARPQSETAGSVTESGARSFATDVDSQRSVLTLPATPGVVEQAGEVEQGGGSPAARPEETVAAPTPVDGASTEVASSEAAAGAAVLNDPASRIRDYLGLHAAGQLPVSFNYEVQAGDNASNIAARFGLEEATVLFNNFDIYDSNHLTVGQLLKLPPVDGLVYTVQPNDGLYALLENFQADLQATLDYPANGISSPDQIQVGQQLLLVHGSASLPATSSVASSGSGGGQSAQLWTVPTFIWPLGYDEISDLFGTARANSVGYHTGVDFTAAVGTIVGSTAAGQISVATWDPSYGNWIEIDHGGGYRSRYAHLNEIWVREGEWIQSNAYIGTVGNTGNSSGAHLHFEIIVDGQAVNPLAWLN